MPLILAIPALAQSWRCSARSLEPRKLLWVSRVSRGEFGIWTQQGSEVLSQISVGETVGQETPCLATSARRPGDCSSPECSISLHSGEERPYTSMGWETQRKSGRLCSNNLRCGQTYTNSRCTGGWAICFRVDIFAPIQPGVLPVTQRGQNKRCLSINRCSGCFGW